MIPRSRFLYLLTLVVLCLLSLAKAQSTVPRIFYSDLQSGPATGGKGSRGAFVTLYGEGFGATRGSSFVNVGTTPAYSYPVWTDTQVSFQIDNTTALGNTNIVVNVGGVASNAVPFTVRAGRIFFASASGSDSQKGTYSRPWRTLAKAVRTMAAGDITYAMGNLVEGASSTGSASLSIARAGSAGMPFALVKYPGSSATIGSATGPSYGLLASTGGYNYWVVAGLTIRGSRSALAVSGATNWRLVGNDVSCPNGSGTGACLLAASSPQLSMLGNRIHDSGSTSSTDLYYYDSVEISSSNVEVGWNSILNTRSCRALRFTSDTGAMSGLTIHDNYIQNAVCDGISLSPVDPSQGAVKVYNNVIERVGTGPAPGGVESTYACVSATGSGAGSVDIHHNTLRDCGARANADSGAILASTTVSVVNNVVSVNAGESYIASNTSNGWLTGSNNLFYGAGAAPAAFTSSVNADPKFVDAANHNFRLQAASPAIDSGMVCWIKKDMDGAPRPQGSSDDLGAFEFNGAATSGQLSFSQSSLAFGTTTVGSSNTQNVSLTNSGTVSTTVTQLNVTGSAFSVSGATLPITLTAGQSVPLTVTFAPTSTGALSGSVTPVTSTPATVASLTLSGSGASAVGSLGASATSLVFGNVNTGSSASKTMTVTASTAAVTISQASMTGAGFSVVSPLLPVTLAAGQSASFTVKFAPTSAGPVTGALTITSDASNSPTTVTASGTGVVQAGTLTPDATSIGFGNVTLGGSSSMPVTFTASVASVTISQATIAGSGFTVTGPALPVTLAVGQSATFSVKFAPTISGPVTGTLSVYSDATNSPSNIAVSGTGVSPAGTLTANSTSLAFGSLTLGSSTSLPVSFTASGGSVTISQAAVTGAGFSVTSPTLPLTLAAGQSATFTVKFAPTTAGAASGGLSLTSTATSSTTVTVSGTGVAPVGTLSASTTSLNFGSLTTGSSASLPVTFTASAASVTISQATISGTGYSFTGITLPMTLAAGQSVTLTVKFAPTVAGTFSGSLTVTSNASTPTVVVVLSGAATAPISHSVTLSWTASTSSGVVGYNVYRGTTSGGPYTKVGSLVAATTYTDSSVAAGATYYYCVTAANSTGGESAYSTQAVATVPTP